MNEILGKRRLEMLLKLKKIKKTQLKTLYNEKRYWYKQKYSTYMKKDVRFKISNCKKVLTSINIKIQDFIIE
tara:strand:- start:923 stop:1138 length:216 start_codon:yes stop_codon:yes gene_type:complete